MCKSLVRAGWAINDIEEADFETLVRVVCENGGGAKKIDLIDWMKQEKGLTVG